MKDCTSICTKLPPWDMQGVVNLCCHDPLLIQVGWREVFILINDLTPFLKDSKHSIFLILRGSSFYDLAALHLKLSWVISKSRSLVCLISPLWACLVLYLYSAANIEWRYLGDLFWMTLCTNTTEWYTTNWCTLKQPHWLSSSATGVLQSSEYHVQVRGRPKQV